MKPNGINRTQEAGFSLVELLVSLALLGMVAAILASGLSLGQGSWRRSEEKAQASLAFPSLGFSRLGLPGFAGC